MTVAASIAAENTFSEPYYLQHGWHDFSLSGTWSATVTVQRAPGSVGDVPESGDWKDVKEFTANAEEVFHVARNGSWYRFGIKTGGYTSGTAVGSIGGQI